MLDFSRDVLLETSDIIAYWTRGNFTCWCQVTLNHGAVRNRVLCIMSAHTYTLTSYLVYWMVIVAPRQAGQELVRGMLPKASLRY